MSAVIWSGDTQSPYQFYRNVNYNFDTCAHNLKDGGTHCRLHRVWSKPEKKPKKDKEKFRRGQAVA